MAYQSPLNNISIKGFKSIRELEDFELTNLNVLIGANGAGKSNFISVFKFLNEIIEQQLQNYIVRTGGFNKLVFEGIKKTNSIEIALKFGRNTYSIKISKKNDDSAYIEKEKCTYQGEGYNDPFLLTVSGNGLESGLVTEKGQVVQTVLQSIHSWKLYHFHDTSESSPMRMINNLNDNQRLRPDASNLAAYLYLLSKKHPAEYSNIIQTIRLVAPFFRDFQLEPNNLSPDKILLEWKHKNTDEYFNTQSLSDGTLRFICLATLLLQPELNLPKTILLDEPELGLHPYAISVLANLLDSVSKKTQVIISTQSVTLINHLKPKDIIVVDRKDGESTFKRVRTENIDSWLEDYGLGDIWEKNILGGRP